MVLSKEGVREGAGDGDSAANQRENVASASDHGKGQNSAHELNLLDGDHYSWLDMDDKTLQCLVGGLPLPDVGGVFSDEAGPSDPAKQMHHHHHHVTNGNHAGWIPESIATKKAVPVKRQQSPEEDEEESRGQTKKGRSEAAIVKADRERKRRERLNQCFEELAGACGAESGGATGYKTDRLSIIVDAIRVVRALRVEVNQLRQLNKFLEERVGTLERERAQSMYTQYQYADSRSLMSPMGMPGQGNHVSIGVPQNTSVYQQSHGHYQDKNNQYNGMSVGQGQGDQPGGDRAAWLPAPNVSEDEKLRPPAA
jgi:hypothetical protein